MPQSKAMFHNGPVATKQYTHTQSKYSDTPKLPARFLLAANTNSGKSNLLLNIILDLFRDCWERIVVFSASFNTDSIWDPFKAYCREKEWNLDECGFDHYSDKILSDCVAEQAQIIRWQKAKNHKRLFGLLIIFDDMMNTREAVRGKQIEKLYSQGRHNNCSVWCSTQSYKRVSNVVRQNSDHELIWRLRNGQDLGNWLQENSAIVGEDKLMEIYRKATTPQFGYLWLNKAAASDDDLFHPDGLGTPGEKIT